MIEKEYNYFLLICDICSEFETFDDAVGCYGKQESEDW